MQDSLLEKLRDVLHWKKNNAYYAARLGVSETEIEWARQEIKKEKEEPDEEEYEPGEITEAISDREKGTDKVTFFHSREALTDEEVYREAKKDPKKWHIAQIWHLKKSKGFLHSVLFKPLSVEQHEVNLLEKLLKNYKGSFYALEKRDILINDVYTRPTCLLISLADFHLDKKTIEEKTMADKVLLYEEVLEKLLYKAYKTHLIDEVVFVLGNDFFHTDSYHSTTTNLTPQDTLDIWYSAYETGFDLMAKTIAKLRQFCNKLTVVHVPSNHSRTKEYYMAHGLSLLFKNDQSIIFNRTAENTKVFTYGENFIGLHHGDTVTDKLPLYFASKYYQDWGRCKHKEIVLADKHHRKDWKFTLSQGEVEGIRMFIAPSLSGVDKWHKDKNFDLSIRAGIARVYDKFLGYCTEFEERI